MTSVVRGSIKGSGARGSNFNSRNGRKNCKYSQLLEQSTFGKRHIKAVGCEGMRQIRKDRVFWKARAACEKALDLSACSNNCEVETRETGKLWGGGWRKPRSCGTQSTISVFTWRKRGVFYHSQRDTWGEREQRWQRASVWPSRPWLVKVSSKDEKVWQSRNRVPQGQCVWGVKFLSPSPKFRKQMQDPCAKRVLRNVGRWWRSRVALSIS